MRYLIQNIDRVGHLLIEHLFMTGEVLGIALIIAIPLGLFIARNEKLREPVLSVLSIIYTIPSLSFFVLLIPILGLGKLSAVVALVAYSQTMLVRNWVVGLASIDANILEAADGMGMNGWQRFYKVEFPLALPHLIAGLRLAAVSTIGIGTIAAYINAGCLGTLLFEGVVTANHQKIVAGSFAVSVLALFINYGLRFFEKRSEVRIHGESQ